MFLIIANGIGIRSGRFLSSFGIYTAANEGLGVSPSSLQANQTSARRVLRLRLTLADVKPLAIRLSLISFTSARLMVSIDLSPQHSIKQLTALSTLLKNVFDRPTPTCFRYRAFALLTVGPCAVVFLALEPVL